MVRPDTTPNQATKIKPALRLEGRYPSPELLRTFILDYEEPCTRETYELRSVESEVLARRDLKTKHEFEHASSSSSLWTRP